MADFLAKTDPATYSAGQFASERRTVWDGVRNPQALRSIRQMRPGDRVFLYHSGPQPAVTGVARVVSSPRADPRDTKLAVVDLEFEGLLSPRVTLREIKDAGIFDDLPLLRQPRLSTMAVPPEFARWILERSQLVR